jgi:hypothetical protein
MFVEFMFCLLEKCFFLGFDLDLDLDLEKFITEEEEIYIREK